ncbi:uncharacterized protein LOC6038502 [Culex quinquefasciatus]|uniref:uncharacterized protein LOC6038502 n=1 Tax=Culex quinquefasciatus TaxID=7176 RepID=UPI0018E37B2A|nr:uncharacterized protein LOC6038502 [Culex quinquefasciatus]
MSFSSNDTMRPLALQRSQSLPQLNSREDSGVGLSGTGSCSGINNIGYESSAGSGGHHHRHHRHHHHRHYRNEVKIPYGTRLVADLRQLMTLRQHYYPEGGWGWLLTVIGFTIHCICHGLHLSAGVFMMEMAAIFRQQPVAAVIASFMLDYGQPS